MQQITPNSTVSFSESCLNHTLFNYPEQCAIDSNVQRIAQMAIEQMAHLPSILFEDDRPRRLFCCCVECTRPSSLDTKVVIERLAISMQGAALAKNRQRRLPSMQKLLEQINKLEIESPSFLSLPKIKDRREKRPPQPVLNYFGLERKRRVRTSKKVERARQALKMELLATEM